MAQTLTVPAIITYASVNPTSGTFTDFTYNSFASLDEADEYHTRRLNNNAYVVADVSTRTSALYWATDILDRQVWIGGPTNDLQTLSWPREFVSTRSTINGGSRVGLYREEINSTRTLLGTSVQYFDKFAIPNFMKDATAELALYLIERAADGSNSVSQYGDQLSNLSLGGLSLQLRENPDYVTDLPYQVYHIISDFMKQVKEFDPSLKQVQSIKLFRR